MTREGLPEFDGRPTVRFTNSAPEHRKIVGLSDAAFRLWFDLVCLTSRAETDGVITEAELKGMRRPGKLLRELTTPAAPDLRPLLEPHPSGWVLHDYLKHNRAKAEIESYREAQSESGKKGMHMRWHVPRRVRVKDCHFCIKEVESA